jgi:histidinol-phosphatase (PHP family)
MFDTHIHTKFSTDSTMDIEKALRKASELNLGLIITDHMDTNFPGKEKFNFEPSSFFRNYGKYRSEKLLLGVELGMTTEFKDENKALIESYPFDYVIGSIHFLGNNDIYYAEAYEGKTKREVYLEYFQAMYDNIKEHSYIDCLAHIDYISRYAVYEDREIYYSDFRNSIDEVLKAVVERGIALEVNTRRLSDRTAVENLNSIYKRYKELGGKLLTLGSDAHGEGAIGINFSQGLEIVRSLELQLVYFKERIPQHISL